MYIHIPGPKQQCSKCGIIDHTEIVTRSIFNGEEKIRRCTQCGHEKVISTTRWTTPEDEFHVYEMKDRPEVEEF